MATTKVIYKPDSQSTDEFMIFVHPTEVRLVSDPLITAYSYYSTRSGKVVVSMNLYINNFSRLTFYRHVKKFIRYWFVSVLTMF